MKGDIFTLSNFSMNNDHSVSLNDSPPSSAFFLSETLFLWLDLNSEKPFVWTTKESSRPNVIVWTTTMYPYQGFIIPMSTLGSDVSSSSRRWWFVYTTPSSSRWMDFNWILDDASQRKRVSDKEKVSNREPSSGGRERSLFTRK